MNGEKGFTLVELLVVVAVLGVLLGVVADFYPTITERVKQRTDQSNLRLLNAVTAAYRAGGPVDDPFALELEDDSLRWHALVPDSVIGQ